MSPPPPSTKLVLGPSAPDVTPSDILPLEMREDVPSTPVTEGEDGVGGHSSPSWLRSGVVMPIEEEALRELASKISNRTPPLRNLRFTNMYSASYLGGVILNWATDIESLAGMGEMGVDEETNRVGALLARVRGFFH